MKDAKVRHIRSLPTTQEVPLALRPTTPQRREHTVTVSSQSPPPLLAYVPVPATLVVVSTATYPIAIMLSHPREAPRYKRLPSDSFADSDSKRARYGEEAEQLRDTQTNSAATSMEVAPTEKRLDERPNVKAGTSGLAEEVDAPFVDAQLDIFHHVSPKPVSLNGPEDADVTGHGGRGETIDTAIVIDDGEDEEGYEDKDFDDAADEGPPRYLSQAKPSFSKTVPSLTDRGPDQRTTSTQRRTMKAFAPVSPTPEDIKPSGNLGNNRLITGFKRFKKDSPPRIFGPNSLESLTAEQLARVTAHLIHSAEVSTSPLPQLSLKPPADHDLVPIDPEDPGAMQVPAFILRKPSPPSYENLSLSEDGKEMSDFSCKTSTIAATPVEAEARGSVSAHVEVVGGALESTVDSEILGEKANTERQIHNHAQLGTTAVEQHIHQHGNLPLGTTIKDQRNIETRIVEAGPIGPVQSESVVNGIEETPLPRSAINSRPSTAVKDLAPDKSAQRIKPRACRDLTTTQVLPSTHTTSQPQAKKQNTPVRMGARATHPHAELVLSLTEEINRLGEKVSRFDTVKRAFLIYTSKLYQENIALKKLLKQNAPHVQLPQALATINTATTAPSKTSLSRQHAPKHTSATSANSSVIDLTHSKVPVEYTNILQILGAADWLSKQEKKLKLNNSFAFRAQALVDDDKQNPPNVAFARTQDPSRHMMNRIWAVYKDAGKAEAAIASLLKLGSVTEQERFLPEMWAKAAEDDRVTSTAAATSEKPHNSKPRRPSVSPVCDRIPADRENVTNALQGQTKPQPSSTRATDQQLFRDLFGPFSAALAAAMKPAPALARSDGSR